VNKINVLNFAVYLFSKRICWAIAIT